MKSVDLAFTKAKRKDFLPSSVKERADIDAPLPIGFGQTNSQPSTVKQMLNWLEVKPGQKILDIGSGSGWTSALLSVLTGSTGTIHSVEKIPELLDFGRLNSQKAGFQNIKFHTAGSEVGLKKYSPFDRILVSAAAKELPCALLGQLKTKGKLVIPIKNDILEITKKTKEEVNIKKHFGFVFVPLV
jgi:protein-L-isoaspartate(D-aspartate) O-methyltransferase